MNKILLEITIGDKSHAGESITVIEVQWKLATQLHPSGGESSGYRHPIFEDLVILKNLDQSSPGLALACAQGKCLRNVTLRFQHLVDGRDVTAYQIDLTNAMVTSILSRTEPVSAEDPQSLIQRELLTLSFEEIRWKYTQSAQGQGRSGCPLSSGWSVRTQQQLR